MDLKDEEGVELRIFISIITAHHLYITFNVPHGRLCAALKCMCRYAILLLLVSLRPSA